MTRTSDRTTARITTPGLVIDLAQLERNIATMAAWTEGRVAIRPHAKAHKCVEIARRQCEAGAIGVTTATPSETLAMAEGGIGSILLANQVMTDDKLDVLAAAARQTDLIVAIDDLREAEAFSTALARANARATALIELDVGMGRGGVRSIDEAVALASGLTAVDRLDVRGVMGYEGHAVLEPDRSTRLHMVAEAMAYLGDAAEALRTVGVPVDIVSAGGTNTFDMTGLQPAVTEIQAGTYALMDLAYASYAVDFAPALGVVGTVIGRHGSRVILDCGTKSIGTTELAEPVPRDSALALVELHEEHALLDVVAGSGPGRGEQVELVASYCGGTAVLHSEYHIVDNGEVVDVWPIVGRSGVHT